MISTNQYLRASLLLAGCIATGGLVLGGCGGQVEGTEDESSDDATLASGSQELVSNPLTPVLTCMDNLGGNNYKAHFGYSNTSSKSVRVPVGLLNFFVPLPANQGQPIDFAAGNHPDVFKVTFSTKDGWDRLAWWLSGRRALATKNTPLCAPPPPPQCASNADCDDANPCTTNTCTSGHCVAAPAPARTACGHAGLCDNAGACVTCLAASDCDDTKACTNDICTAGACTHPPTAAGTACGHQGQCDGAGLCGSPACTIDTDCDDGDSCTTDSCISGACSHAPAPPRTACGHAGLCDNTGLCVSCLTAADCDDTKVCTQDVCTAGACTHPPTPAGTTCGHAGHCDGSGLCGL